MYKSIILLKNPIAIPEDLEKFIKEMALKISINYDGHKLGEYGSDKNGFVPIYCFTLNRDDYVFKINYQEGLGPFQSNATKNFVRTDYNARFEIYSN